MVDVISDGIFRKISGPILYPPKMEEWRPAFECYEISSYGNLRRRMRTNEYREVQGSIIGSTGYRYFQLQRDGKRLNFFFHQLVAAAFLGIRPEGHVIDHIDRNKLNNAVANLRYCTPRENCKNTSRYLAHIEEDDPEKRRKLVKKEWHNKNRERMRAYREIYEQQVKLQKMIENYERAHTTPCRTPQKKGA